MAWTKPRLLLARAVQGGRKVEQLAGVNARCHIFPTPSASWMCCVCGQGLRQEEAWDTKEGEFHSPSSPSYTLPRLFVFILWRPRRSVLGQARVLGNQLAWLSPCSEDKQKLPMTGTLALLLQEQKGPPHPRLSPEEPMSISPLSPAWQVVCASDATFLFSFSINSVYYFRYNPIE